MNRKTTLFIGGLVGAAVGFFFGPQFSKPAEVATTEAIDRIDSDDDDVNALSSGKKDTSGDDK